MYSQRWQTEHQTRGECSDKYYTGLCGATRHCAPPSEGTDRETRDRRARAGTHPQLRGRKGVNRTHPGVRDWLQSTTRICSSQNWALRDGLFLVLVVYICMYAQELVRPYVSSRSARSHRVASSNQTAPKQNRRPPARQPVISQPASRALRPLVSPASDAVLCCSAAGGRAPGRAARCARRRPALPVAADQGRLHAGRVQEQL